jgi:hypothetical protein
MSLSMYGTNQSGTVQLTLEKEAMCVLTLEKKNYKDDYQKY